MNPLITIRPKHRAMKARHLGVNPAYRSARIRVLGNWSQLLTAPAVERGFTSPGG